MIKPYLDRSVKQVIIMRNDLNMRKGKMVSQGAHASLKVIIDRLDITHMSDNHPIKIWLNNSFTKICVQVNSEDELDNVYQQAIDKKIPCALIIDNGLTEFKGIKTKTCCAIGPWWSDEIDLITKDLKLL